MCPNIASGLLHNNVLLHIIEGVREYYRYHYYLYLLAEKDH